MGITNQASVDAANTMFHAYAEQLFAGAAKTSVYESFVETRETSSEINEIDILEAMPAMREWLGEKRYTNARVSTLSVSMKSWEKSFEIQRRKLEGSSIPDISARIQSWLGNFAGVYDKLAFSALVSNPTCYDGVALFSASHPRGPSGNQNNITTSAFSLANHKAIVRTMQELRDEQGESFEVSPNVIVCGPKMLPDVLEITKSTERLAAVANDGLEAGTRVAAATIPNVWAGAEVYGGGAMVVVKTPRFVGSYDDYVLYLDTAKGVKPIVCFEKRKPEVVAQIDMTSEKRFNEDKYTWSLEADMVFAPAAWQVAHLIAV